MNIIAFVLFVASVVVFLVEWVGRSGRTLLALGLALFAAGVLVAAVWPSPDVLIK